LELVKTHLYEFHKENGNIVDFSGYAMPVWYEGIIDEHNAVREHCGVFDTSHMGRTRAIGPEAEKFVNYLITNDASSLDENEGIYSVMCRPNGGIVDDLITYKLGPENFFIVYNASNREKDFNWFKENAKNFDIQLTDVSNEIAMIAVQGPDAEDILQELTQEDLSEIERFNIGKTTISGFETYAARTGYTGEDGFEIYVLDCPRTSPEKALKIWNDLVNKGAVPCGLGARDTLRLEAGLSLYGNDIDESTNPYEAGLGWVVKLDKPSYFVGKRAIEQIKEEGIDKKLVGIEMIDRGIPRHGYEIVNEEGESIGVVTSGAMSPTLGVGIAMGYVPPEESKRGNEVGINIRERIAKGKIVKHHPFYDPSEYGWKREE
jgi:aminomethyltransferase